MVKVFFGIPTYNNWVTSGCMLSAMKCCRVDGPVGYQPEPQVYPSSLLAKAFNVLWSQAIIDDADVFVMLHADIGASDGWLDELVAILLDRRADLVSANVRLKDQSFEYSTAIDGDDGRVVRLNQADLGALPDVFNRLDVAKHFGMRKAGALLLNTGCWAANLKRGWAKQVYFDVNSALTWYPAGQKPQCRLTMESEDWFLSRQLHKLNIKGVYGTSRITTEHLGDTVFRSDITMTDALREKLLERIRGK